MTAWTALPVVCALLCACSGGRDAGKPHEAPVKDIMTLRTAYAPVKNGQSGAPVDELVVSGTIANHDARPLPCGNGSFLVTNSGGDSVQPAVTWCDVPEIGVRNASAFNVTFRALPAPPVELRFEHGDGTYEARTLNVPKH